MRDFGISFCVALHCPPLHFLTSSHLSFECFTKLCRFIFDTHLQYKVLNPNFPIAPLVKTTFVSDSFTNHNFNTTTTGMCDMPYHAWKRSHVADSATKMLTATWHAPSADMTAWSSTSTTCRCRRFRVSENKAKNQNPCQTTLWC